MCWHSCHGRVRAIAVGARATNTYLSPPILVHNPLAEAIPHLCIRLALSGLVQLQAAPACCAVRDEVTDAIHHADLLATPRWWGPNGRAQPRSVCMSVNTRSRVFRTTPTSTATQAAKTNSNAADDRWMPAGENVDFLSSIIAITSTRHDARQVDTCCWCQGAHAWELERERERERDLAAGERERDLDLGAGERDRDLDLAAGERERDLDLAAGERERERDLDLAAGERERERDFLLAGAAAGERLRRRRAGERLRLRRRGERLRRRRPWDRERLRRRPPPPPRPRPSSSRTRMIALSKGLRNSESSSVRMALRMSSKEPYSTTPEPSPNVFA